MIKNLGTRLRESRQQSNMTQECAGSLAGIKGQTLSLYENDNALPSLEVFYKLVANYRASADWVLGLSSEKSLKLDGLSDENIELLQTMADKLRLSQQPK